MKLFLVITALILTAYLLLVLFFYFKQETFIFHPEELPADYSFSFSAPFEEVYLDSPDGAVINALHFKVPHPKGTVLYFHGNSGSLRTWGVEGIKFTQLGYNLLIADYRSYGKSSGKLSFNAILEDALLQYEYLANQLPEKDIIIYGRSIGTGIATYVASKQEPRALLLETPYYSFTELVSRYFPFIPYKWILEYRFATSKYLQTVDCPVYAIHGTSDRVVPFASGKKLADEFPRKIRFESVSGGTHNNLIEYEQYHNWLKMALQWESYNISAQTKSRKSG